MPVFYSLGNFIFDQNWSTYTMESFLLEAPPSRVTGSSSLHPFIFARTGHSRTCSTPAKGEGRRLLQQVRAASDGMLDW